MFKFLRNCLTVFRNGHTISYFHQQYKRVLISPYPHLHLFIDWLVFKKKEIDFLSCLFMSYWLVLVCALTEDWICNLGTLEQRSNQLSQCLPTLLKWPFVSKHLRVGGVMKLMWFGFAFPWGLMILSILLTMHRPILGKCLLRALPGFELDHFFLRSCKNPWYVLR